MGAPRVATRSLAVAGWALAAAGVVTQAILRGLTPAERVLAIFVLALPTVGALVAARRPTHPVGWMLLGASLAAFGLTAIAEIGEQLGAGDGRFWPSVLVWLSGFSFVGIVLLGIHVPLRFPDGSLPGPAWRRVERLAHVATALFALGILFAPGPMHEHEEVLNPFGVGPSLEPLVGVAAGLGSAGLLVAALGALASLVVRGRRAGDEVRRQLRWLLLAAGLVVAATLLLVVNPLIGVSEDAAVLVFGAITLVVLPGAIGVAILRHRAFDIDLLIRRSLVYGVLWLAITALYGGVAVALGLAAGTRLPVGIAVGLTVLTTLVFAPVRRRLERFADRWVFGPTPTPPEMLAGLGEVLRTANDLEAVAADLAGTLKAGLRLRWVEVAVDGSPAVTAGAPAGEAALTVPIAHGDQVFGDVRCGPRDDTGSMSDGDAQLVRALASHTGLALHSAALAERLVEAHDTERRRIERNIHDGAQQQLAALMARMGIARQQLNGSDSEGVLLSLQSDVRAIMEDLRALAQGIHPSVLTDGGLAEAVAQRCDSSPIPVSVDVDRFDGVRLADEIEGGAYFLVSEALANVLKHARAASASIRMTPDDGWLVIEVSDDGVGFHPQQMPGSGLRALADRLSALGGALEVHSGHGEGTTVRGRLPLRTRNRAGVGDG